MIRLKPADTIIVLENDVYRYLNSETADKLFNAAKNIIVIDHLENATLLKANYVLPAATFAEGSGTLINNEGRAQRFFKVFSPTGDIQESWRWISDIMRASGSYPETYNWQNLDGIIKSLAEEMPIFKTISEAAPSSEFRIAGQKIPRQPNRYSGRTAMHADINVNEPKPPQDCDSPLCFSMEGYRGQPASSLIARFWSPKWNSVQSVNKFQREVGGQLYDGDPGKRLIEPRNRQSVNIFRRFLILFTQRKKNCLLCPLIMFLALMN